ncbi:MAG: hypothetical protein R2747_08820 [Pyrinomonadaceae bacterium]
MENPDISSAFFLLQPRQKGPEVIFVFLLERAGFCDLQNLFVIKKTGKEKKCPEEILINFASSMMNSPVSDLPILARHINIKTYERHCSI